MRGGGGGCFFGNRQGACRLGGLVLPRERQRAAGRDALNGVWERCRKRPPFSARLFPRIRQSLLSTLCCRFRLGAPVPARRKAPAPPPRPPRFSFLHPRSRYGLSDRSIGWLFLSWVVPQEDTEPLVLTFRNFAIWSVRGGSSRRR
jgi:hypothetical protein